MRWIGAALVVLAACGASDRRPVDQGVHLIPSVGAERLGSFIPAPPPTTTTSTSSTTSSTPPRTGPPARAGRGGPRSHSLGRFRVTCYDPASGFPAGQHTASGRPVGWSSVAVDPGMIPLGTWLELEGIGRRRADDTGSKVKGHHLDAWRESCKGWTNPTVEVWTS